MTLRKMTPEERSELTQAINERSWHWGIVALGVFATALCVMFSAIAGIAIAGLVLGVAGFENTIRAAAQSAPAQIVGWIAAVACAAYFGVAFIRDYQKHSRRIAMLTADLMYGDVEEHHVIVNRVARFREPEHWTELLLVETEDGRVCALWDDSTTNTDGGRPKRSKLQVRKEMKIVVFPVSQRLTVSFSGATLRKPTAKELGAKPQKWPDDGCWLAGKFDEVVSRLHASPPVR